VASTPPLSDKHRAALLSNVWFAGLPESVREAILAHARRRSLAAGERLFSRDDRAEAVFGILEGHVRVGRIEPKGRETLLDIYGPGSWIGEVSVLADLPRLYDADANGATVILQVTAEDMEMLLADHPTLSRALLRLEAHRLSLVLDALALYSNASLEQRLASRLLMLPASHGVTNSQGVAIELHLPQETLGQLIGATRQRVNAILKGWERDGLVAQRYGHILIHDRARLEALCEI
jgi:CRP-like cAMP-binding protein